MGAHIFNTDLLFNIVVVASVLLVVIQLRKFTGVLPAVVKGLFKWKENLALEFSVRLSRDRNFCYAALVPPACLMFDRHFIAHPSFLSGIHPDLHLASTFLLFFAYVGLRNLMQRLCRSPKIDAFAYTTAFHLFRTVFCAAVPVCLLTLGALTLAHASDMIVNYVIFYELLLFFLLLLWRKWEILRRHRSVLTTFLYLCGLEILPAGLLAVLCLF